MLKVEARKRVKGEGIMNFVEITDLPFCNEPEELFKMRCQKGIKVRDLWKHIEKKHGKTPMNTEREQAIELLKEAEKDLLGIT